MLHWDLHGRDSKPNCRNSPRNSSTSSGAPSYARFASILSFLSHRLNSGLMEARPQRASHLAEQQTSFQIITVVSPVAFPSLCGTDTFSAVLVSIRMNVVYALLDTTISCIEIAVAKFCRFFCLSAEPRGSPIYVSATDYELLSNRADYINLPGPLIRVSNEVISNLSASSLHIFGAIARGWRVVRASVARHHCPRRVACGGGGRRRPHQRLHTVYWLVPVCRSCCYPALFQC